MLRFVVVGVLFLSACTGVQATQPNWVGEVEYVIDGDTIIVDALHIRLVDIDAPELGSPWGEDAKWFMIELLLGEEVELFCEGVDKYDRWLCDVRVDGVSVGNRMVVAGHATVWVDYVEGR